MAVYLIMRSLATRIPSEGPYALGVGRHCVLNPITYLYWNNILLFPNYLNIAPLLTFPRIPMAGIAPLLVIFVVNAILLHSAYAHYSRRVTMYCALWYVLNLSVFYMMPNHVYAYYANISLFGFLTIMCLGLWPIIKYRPKLSITSLVLLITVCNAAIVRVHYRTSWGPIQARFANEAVSHLRERYAVLRPKTEMCIVDMTNRRCNVNSELALFSGRAFQLYYPDVGLTTRFVGCEDSIRFLSSFGSDRRKGGMDREGGKRIVLKVFPRKWFVSDANGGSTEISECSVL